MSSRSRDPTPAELQQAAEGFTAWVKSKAPGAVVFVSGGFSVMKLGGPRTTKDVDLAMDLSGTKRPTGTRPYDTNALKDLAAQEPDKFLVGPKIFWKLPSVDVQVDFVDARLFWQPPEILRAVVQFPGTALLSLDAPTLLVGKIVSAIERAQPDKRERQTKQINDMTDALFLAHYCVSQHAALTAAQLQHMRARENLTAFAELFGELLDTQLPEFQEAWNALCKLSGAAVPETWRI